jgi:signal transduction histidine kinase
MLSIGRTSWCKVGTKTYSETLFLRYNQRTSFQILRKPILDFHNDPAMQKDSLRYQAPIEVLFSFAVLAVLLAYMYASFFEVPYCGFYFNPYDGEILDVYFDDGVSEALLEGDVLEQVGQISWESYQMDTSLVLFEGVQPNQIVDIIVKREGLTLTIPWRFPGFNQREFIARLINIWWLGFIFWFFGMTIQLFVRPKDVRWRLFIAANYLTGLWLIFGSLSAKHVWGSSMLLHATTWLALPVYLQLHWIFPKPLGRMPRIVLPILYLLGFALAVAELMQILPRALYALGFLLTLLGSIILLVLHFIRQPAQRREVTQLAIAMLAALIPSILLSIVGIFGNVSASSPLALLFLPIMPGAYFYIAFRRQLGGLELRANRIISVYLFLILVGIFLLLFIPPANLLLISPEATTIVTMTIAICIVCVGILAFPKFQAFVEQRLLGVKLPFQNLQERYSERITTSASLEDLLQLLKDELVPSLFLRQFVFVHLVEGSPRILLTVGINKEKVPGEQNIAGLIQRVGTDRFYLSSNQDRAYPWVQLILPLKVGENLIGIWLLGRRDPDDIYPQAEIPILQSLANQTAIALSNILQAENLRSMYETNIDRYEQEKLRLAHDLHDRVLNDMAALLISGDAPILSPKFQQAYDALTERLREIVNDLRPPMLNFGLKLALEDFVENLRERSPNSIEIKVELKADSEWRYPEIVETNAYRIVQQACENSLRHAHAKKIIVFGALYHDRFEVKVVDDGIGLDPEISLRRNDLLASRHFGLVGMLERANSIGAELNIASQPNQGTRIQLLWKSKESI